MTSATDDHQDPRRVAARMLASLEMFEDGVDMIRCRLRRQFPNASPEELSALVRGELRASKQDSDPYLQPARRPRF